MAMREAIVGQFKKPRGFLGRLAGWIMARRPSNRERNLWTVDLLDIQSGEEVLEIGCGPGLALAACLERAREGHVVGLDHSATMLNQARARNAAAVASGRLALISAPLDALPPDCGPFDKAFSVNLVQFLPDKTAAFQTLHGLLKPGGRIATTYMPRSKNPTRDEALQMAQEVERAMAAAGFIDIRIEELPLDPAPAVCVIGTKG